MSASPLSPSLAPLGNSVSGTNDRPVSILLSPAAPSGLAERRRANKHLSLCLMDTAHANAGPATPNLKTARLDNTQTKHYRNGPVCLLPRLYLGSEENAEDLSKLRQLSIGAIFNVASEVNNDNEHLFQSVDELLSRPMANGGRTPALSRASSVCSSNGSSLASNQSNTNTNTGITNRASTDPFMRIAYKKLPWEHTQDLTEELPQLVDTIRQTIARGYNVLVHCQCGVARSASVIIAYVMATQNLTMQEAYDYVKSRAPAVSPNMELLYQLNEYEQRLNAKHLEQVPEVENIQPEPVQQKKKLPRFPNPIGIAAAWRRKVLQTTKVLSSYALARENPHRPAPRMPRTPRTPRTPRSRRTSNVFDGEGWWRPKRLSRAINTPVYC